MLGLEVMNELTDVQLFTCFQKNEELYNCAFVDCNPIDLDGPVFDITQTIYRTSSVPKESDFKIDHHFLDDTYGFLNTDRYIEVYNQVTKQTSEGKATASKATSGARSGWDTIVEETKADLRGCQASIRLTRKESTEEAAKSIYDSVTKGAPNTLQGAYWSDGVTASQDSHVNKARLVEGGLKKSAPSGSLGLTNLSALLSLGSLAALSLAF